MSNVLNNPKHTFSIAAYKESPYLETAVKSAVNQTVKSDVYITTGTPNDYIYSVARKYNVPVLVNTTENAQTSKGNFEFGMANAKTELVTIVHQDDYYAPTYAEEVIKAAKGRNPIIVFTDYFEIRGREKVCKNKILKVKRMMNNVIALFPRSKFVRKRVLAFGCSICCPSVTYTSRTMEAYRVFEDTYKSGLGDWAMWIKWADFDGDYIYVKKPLVGHRIHEQSDTSRGIADGTRGADELRILESLWPKPIAKIIYKKYHTAVNSNSKE